MFFISLFTRLAILTKQEKLPQLIPWLHQLVVDFGKEISQKYPTIFRDVYLTCAYDTEKMAGTAFRKGNHPLLRKPHEKEGM